ncbi:MAG: hypothetical protein QOH95_358 [Gaiellaceae bacterium]|jgi:hypothetical protein|nr:hypothetical protein [Gaiellaceae bacterium]
MTKRTTTAEEREWDANREERREWMLQLLNSRWRELQAGESRRAPSAIRRRLFPWRIRIERLG